MEEFVGDQNDGFAFVAQSIKNSKELICFGRRQNACWFIQNKNISAPVQRLENLDTLLHAHTDILDQRIGLHMKFVLFRKLRELARREAELRHEIGLGNLMWGTDDPHPEGTWPSTRKMMVETFHGLPEDEIAAMLGGNAASFYGFDLDVLNPLAERIGPERARFRDESGG